jgi:histidinol-phosphate aminotransferase
MQENVTTAPPRGETPVPRALAAALPPAPAPRPVATGSGSLASNECLLPPSAAARAAMAAAAQDAHRYPDGAASGLRAEIAAEHGIDADEVVVGNGSEEILALLLAAYAGRGGRVALADPACAVHERVCRLVGTESVHCGPDLASLAARPADVALICNPHNPTGTTVTSDDVAAFLADRRAGLVVVDEAYVDFADDPARVSSVRLVRQRRDLAVVRTFSKLHGLAGARVGYLIAAPEIAATARRLHLPFPVNAAAQAGAAAALRDRAHRTRAWTLTREHRTALTALLTRAGYEVVPSQANFVLVRTPDEEGFVRRLAAGGVTVRAGRAMGVPGTARVTVPDREGLRMVAEALDVEPPPTGWGWHAGR